MPMRHHTSPVSQKLRRDASREDHPINRPYPRSGGDQKAGGDFGDLNNRAKARASREPLPTKRSNRDNSPPAARPGNKSAVAGHGPGFPNRRSKP